jgi:hypothetical protein
MQKKRKSAKPNPDTVKEIARYIDELEGRVKEFPNFRRIVETRVKSLADFKAMGESKRLENGMLAAVQLLSDVMEEKSRAASAGAVGPSPPLLFPDPEMRKTPTFFFRESVTSSMISSPDCIQSPNAETSIKQTRTMVLQN